MVLLIRFTSLMGFQFLWSLSKSQKLSTIHGGSRFWLLFGSAKEEKYYGFQGHLVISAEGVITGFSLTTANASEREALWDVIEGIRGLLLGDKGYLSAALENDLSFYHIELQTPKPSNMIDERPKHWVQLLIKTRRLIETVIGQLVERFHFAKVKARDLWHLTSRIHRKLLAHTVALWLNRHSHHPLSFQ